MAVAEIGAEAHFADTVWHRSGYLGDRSRLKEPEGSFAKLSVEPLVLNLSPLVAER